MTIQYLRTVLCFIVDDCYPYLADWHLISCQCTGLIRTNDWRTPEGLDRRQTANYGVLLSHSPRAEGEAGCNYSWKPLGYSSDGQGHGDLEVVDGTLLKNNAYTPESG